MDVHLVGFSTPNFAKSHALLNKSARKHGIKNIINYTSDDIVGTEFYAQNKSIFALKRGYGFWLWKPYIILEALLKDAVAANKIPTDKVFAATDFVTKALERCNADDDTHADEFSAQGLALATN